DVTYGRNRPEARPCLNSSVDILMGRCALNGLQRLHQRRHVRRWRPSVDNRHKIGWRDNDGASQSFQSVAAIPSPHPALLAAEPLKPLLLRWLRSGVELRARLKDG